MNIYLHQDDKQTGPFTEQQIRQMLQTAAIRVDTLGWKEGMAAWEPLSSLGFQAPALVVSSVPSTVPASKRSALGLISFIISLVSLVGWAILLTVAGMAANAGTATNSFHIVVGLFVLLGLTLNFAGMILGVVGAFKSRANIFAILGACLNAFIMMALVALVIIGLTVKHGQTS